MSDLLVKVPINGVSFGQVSYNLLKQMFENGLDIALFPIGDKADLSCYDKCDEKFQNWIRDSIQHRYNKLSPDTPSFSLWHIKGSESSLGEKSLLYTFHETSEAHENEKNVISMYDKVLFSSSFSKSVFDGCPNVDFVPIGFDTDIKKTEKKYFRDDIIHFTLVGKFEKRKNTKKILELWSKKYGNNSNYSLSCLINNGFMDAKDLNKELNEALGNKRVFNINFLPYLKTNSEVNDLYNSCDIDLSGLSSGEGWNLPSFNTTALGKWSIVSNYSSHKDWANNENCILVEPSGSRSVEDGVFFNNVDFNCGTFCELSDESIMEAFEKAEKLAKTPNPKGEELTQKFTYKKMYDDIMSHIKSM